MSNKYALLIGINYLDTANELAGCINDVKNTKKMLTSKLGFSEENIVLMSDEEKGELYPTGENILKQLRNLLIKVDKTPDIPTKIWFHYSGHGSQVKDTDGDETDGKDEVIVPVDYDNGLITDDLLYDVMSLFNKNCEIFAVYDCCNSGSILDLKYTFRFSGTIKFENAHKPFQNAKIVMLSGCKDHQTSADAYIENQATGALTYALLKSVEKKNYNLTYLHLLDTVHNILKQGEFTQRPQLSASYKLSPTKMFCATEQPTFTVNL